MSTRRTILSVMGYGAGVAVLAGLASAAGGYPEVTPGTLPLPAVSPSSASVTPSPSFPDFDRPDHDECLGVATRVYRYLVSGNTEGEDTLLAWERTRDMIESSDVKDREMLRLMEANDATRECDRRAYKAGRSGDL